MSFKANTQHSDHGDKLPRPAKPLHIALNLLYLIPGEMGGAETYALSLLQTILRLDHNNSYSIFVNASGSRLPLPTGPNIKTITVPISGHSRFLRYLWEQIVLPIQVGHIGADVLHSLHYVGPILAPCSTVVTIHDANSIAVGKDMPLLKRLGLRTISRWAANTSNAVVADSHFSKSELLEKLGVKAQKVHVIHLGCGWLERNSPDEATIKRKYGLDRPYISTFGGGYPHKNIPRLIKAFAELYDKTSPDLVIIGRLAPNTVLSDLASKEVLSRIKLLGYVPTEDISPLLKASRLFAFPSLYEGFGLPILEAQRAGTAVVCSSASAIPEVAGECAEFFDPTNVSGIAEALKKVLTNEPRRRELILLGANNVKRFSWEATAQEYLDVYRSVAQGELRGHAVVREGITRTGAETASGDTLG